MSVVILISIAACGCVGGQVTRAYTVVTGGSAQGGKQAIVQYRCGSCHMIPGIRNANGVFGPPLSFFGRRTYIAGQLPNVPENLVQWIVSPQSVKPKTTMPMLGVSKQQARDIAAYLYRLQ